MLTILLLSSCGDFAYKQGANAEQLYETKKLCQSINSEESAVQQCMKEHGWTITRMNDVDSQLVATAKPSEDSRAYKPPVSEKADAGTQAPPSGEQVTPVPDRYKISSWWKVGSGNDELKQAKSECVKQLGEGSGQDPVTKEASRDYLICMKKAGWTGLRAQ